MMEQMRRYRCTAERLQHAISAQAQARAEYDAARDAYEDSRNALIVRQARTTTERLPAEVREAMQALELVKEIGALRCARERLRAADTELESARIAERAERETLRCNLYGQAQ